MSSAVPQTKRPKTARHADGSTGQVVAYVRSLIDRGELGPGDQLPAERDLAIHIGVSRPTVRAGLRALSAMGVVQSRHGSGTFIPAGLLTRSGPWAELPPRSAGVAMTLS